MTVAPIAFASSTAVMPTPPAASPRADALAYLTATEEERDFSEIVVAFQQYVEGECVYCNHCLPCPSNIDIGNTILCVGFTQWDGVTDWLRGWYAGLPALASECIECGLCSYVCVSRIPIFQYIKLAKYELERAKTLEAADA